MFYEYAYMIAEAAFGLIAGIPTFAVSIAVYVLSALALYAIARRRELKNPWLSWVPVGNVWILGSISDQYSYVAKGEVKSKRKILLALNIIQIVLILAVMVMAVSMGVQAIGAGITGRMDEAIARGLLGSLAGILGLCVPLLGVAITLKVIRYIALYDLYRSCDPQNAVLFLVLGIFFKIAEPICLFVCRGKDEGMPPRRERTDYIPQELGE